MNPLVDKPLDRSRDGDPQSTRTLSPIDFLSMPPPPSILVRPRDSAVPPSSTDGSSDQPGANQLDQSHSSNDAILKSSPSNVVKTLDGSVVITSTRPVSVLGGPTFLTPPTRIGFTEDSTGIGDQRSLVDSPGKVSDVPNPRQDLLLGILSDQNATPNSDSAGMGIGVTFHPTVSMVSTAQTRPRFGNGAGVPNLALLRRQGIFGVGSVPRTLSIDSSMTTHSHRSYFSLKKEFERIAKNSPQPFYRKRHIFRFPMLLFDFGEEDQEHRASWEELFYDLLYVGAIIRVDVIFGYEPTLHGIVVVAVYFLIFWWSWNLVNGYYSRFSANDRIHGLLNWIHMLGVMAMGLTSQLPFNYKQQFSIACIVSRVPILLMYLMVQGGIPRARVYSVYAIAGLTISIALFTAAACLPRTKNGFIPATRSSSDSPVGYVGTLGNGTTSGLPTTADLSAVPAADVLAMVLWLLAVMAEMVGTLFVTKKRNRIRIHVGHVAERHGLFVILLLGESVVNLITGPLPVLPEHWFYHLFSFLTAWCLMLQYFDTQPFDASTHIMSRSRWGGRAIIALHFLLSCGILSLSVGNRMLSYAAICPHIPDANACVSNFWTVDQFPYVVLLCAGASISFFISQVIRAIHQGIPDNRQGRILVGLRVILSLCMLLVPWFAGDWEATWSAAIIAIMATLQILSDHLSTEGAEDWEAELVKEREERGMERLERDLERARMRAVRLGLETGLADASGQEQERGVFGLDTLDDYDGSDSEISHDLETGFFEEDSRESPTPAEHGGDGSTEENGSSDHHNSPRMINHSEMAERRAMSGFDADADKLKYPTKKHVVCPSYNGQPRAKNVTPYFAFSIETSITYTL
ncbi:hypothetical protein M427DRAFT_70285 [Gonapodya prolifera JEL478]|uniref:Uncharacterized protein n=1 Tax=Gonapodya prolifera (strain JEL478) TaxID=1344416 RepID=A0A139ADW1_GONPJ|nr:hypothetical protein M427DRAFT_70285 [Gonapodya prolifera JEL478]|eukprot:KXS14957.1 hypothetical protein M427DRAFT_70285 [Gonapodya prolifera JEL478]